MRQLLRAAAIAVFVTATASVADAGTTGGISGHVTWKGSGIPLAGIVVEACSLSDLAMTRTNARGFYSFVSLAPDRYEVYFLVPLHPAMWSAVHVSADAMTTLDEHACPGICEHVGPPPPPARPSSSAWTIDDYDVKPVRHSSCELGTQRSRAELRSAYYTPNWKGRGGRP